MTIDNLVRWVPYVTTIHNWIETAQISLLLVKITWTNRFYSIFLETLYVNLFIHCWQFNNPLHLVRVDLYVFCVTLPKKMEKVPLSPQTQTFPASFVDTQFGFTSPNTASLSIEKTAPDNHHPLGDTFFLLTYQAQGLRSRCMLSQSS